LSCRVKIQTLAQAGHKICVFCLTGDYYAELLAVLIKDYKIFSLILKIRHRKKSNKSFRLA